MLPKPLLQVRCPTYIQAGVFKRLWPPIIVFDLNKFSSRTLKFQDSIRIEKVIFFANPPKGIDAWRLGNVEPTAHYSLLNWYYLPVQYYPPILNELCPFVFTSRNDSSLPFTVELATKRRQFLTQLPRTMPELGHLPRHYQSVAL